MVRQPSLVLCLRQHKANQLVIISRTGQPHTANLGATAHVHSLGWYAVDYFKCIIKMRLLSCNRFLPVVLSMREVFETARHIPSGDLCGGQSAGDVN